MILRPYDRVLLRSPLNSLQDVRDLPINTAEPIFEEGLYLSSPEFWNEFKRKEFLKGKKREKLTLSFAKYWLRSCTRCTPYATFAGNVLLDAGEGPTGIIINPREQHRRSVRLDMNYVALLVHALSRIPMINEQIHFYRNNSIYELADSFRYVEYSIHNNTRNYHLSTVHKTSYLQTVVTNSRNGVRLAELCRLLMDQESVTQEEAGAFLKELCEAQLLVSELEPCVTGKEPLDQLLDRLRPVTGIEDIYGSLVNIRELLNRTSNGVDHYLSVDRELRKLNIDIEIPRNTIQTDLYLSATERTVNKDVLECIVAQTGDLMFLSRKNQNSHLTEFATAFARKYDEQEVPLSIALDADLGIGYAGITDELAGGSDLIDDIPYAGDYVQMQANDYIQQYVYAKYYDYLKNKREMITLSPEELKTFEGQVKELSFPVSLFLMGSIFKKNGILDPLNFEFDLTAFGGPNAANLLSRFTHGDENLRSFCREILASEEVLNPAVIFGEIIHLPQARIGNVLLRPVLRQYEIPYVGRSGADTENQIFIDDIQVSVRQGEVILRSKAYNRRILPRLTSAHNYANNSLPIYKFLCDLQQQGEARPGIWDWGQLASEKYLPRVVYQNIILKKAIWQINESDIKDLPESGVEFEGYFENFRRRLAIPQRVVLAQSDNTLLIDFATPEGISLFLHYLKRHKNILLEEFLFTEGNCVVKDAKDKPYTNELIIPVQYLSGRTTPVAMNRPIVKEVQRKFPPNSEWLYLKIYSGRKTTETILKEDLLPFVKQGLAHGLFEYFFITRYRDESSHIRIRFYNSDVKRQEQVQAAISQTLLSRLNAGSVDRIVVDTYVRELERYGGELIEEVEKLYFNDSLAVLEFINMLEGNEAERYRFLFALRGVDMWLEDFKLSLPEKRKVLQHMQAAYFREFGGHGALQKQLNEKYRKYQQSLFSHLDEGADEQNGVSEAAAIFKRRSEMNSGIVRTIFQKVGGDQGRIFMVLPSVIHMFLNRMFIAQARKQELVVYHFLEKYYTSQTALQKVQ